MKLLDRNEVNIKLSGEKKLAVDQGIALARKVDALRQTASEEEAKLAKFRLESIKKLHSDIEEADAEKAKLLEEIVVAKAELKMLREPLDSEWKKLHEIEVSLGINRVDLDARRTTLQMKQEELKILESELIIKNGELDVALGKASSDKEVAAKLLSDAKETMLKANENSLLAEKRIKGLGIQALERETAVSVREREQKMKEERLNAREIELNKRETVINDRYQTLLRAEKRK